MTVKTQMENDKKLSDQWIDVRCWTCPEHETPLYNPHECDCEQCVQPRFACEKCAKAEWKPVLTKTGRVKRRRLTNGEVNGRRWVQAMVEPLIQNPSPFLALMESLEKPLSPSSPKVVWMADSK